MENKSIIKKTTNVIGIISLIISIALTIIGILTFIWVSLLLGFKLILTCILSWVITFSIYYVYFELLNEDSN